MFRPITGTLLATGLLFSASVTADPPESFTNPPLPIGIGGDSVTGGGEWAVVTDTSTCAIQIFRLDYATMTWGDFQTVTSILGGTCTNGEFGLSSSLSGDVLVVGSPGWDGGTFLVPNSNNQGGIAIFRFDGTTWARQSGLNNAFGFIERAPDFQNGARYGSSVSISRVDANNYTVLVGAPFFDGPGAGSGNNSGKVYAYNYDAATNDLSFIDDQIGSTGWTFGFTVTVNQPYFLIGAPGVGTGGINDSPGGAYVYRLIGGTLTLNDILTEPGTDSLGREVSLSADFALVSSDAASLVWENTGTPTVRSYAGTPANTITGSNGGDVTQSAGVAFLGRLPPGLAGATGLRDPINDDFSFTGFNVPVTVDYAGDNVTNVGADIRLARESLFLANPAEDRALLYQYPAGFGGFAETPFTYYQRSLPCDVTGLTLADVFGPGSFGSSPAGTYDVFLYDATAPVTSGRPFKQLDDGYVFTAEDADYSLWIATDTPRYTPIETCNDFTVPDFIPPVDGGTPFVSTVRTQSVIELPNPAFDTRTGETFARIMVNMPYPRDVLLADVRYVDGGGGIKTLSDADAADEVFSTVYIYDPTATIPSGQNYRAVTASGTPPFNDRIRGYEGFWVRVEENSADGSVLLMPQPE